MELYTAIISHIFQYGVSLGVGASTMTIALWLTSIKDGVIDTSEHTLLHIAYLVLRVAMVLIGIALGTSLVFAMFPQDIQYAFQWAFFGVLVTNAFLMTYHKIPMSFAPMVQGGTWYALFFITLLPIQSFPFVIIGLVYLLWLFVVYLAIRAIMNHLEKNHGRNDT